MHTIAERFLIAKFWVASFARSAWAPADYPIVTRKQVGMGLEATWCARVLNWTGPVGLGKTEQEARTALLHNLAEVASNRRSRREAMPRPGTGLPIKFASTDRVNADPALLDDFIEKALGFNAGDPVFISDESSIGDFGDTERVSLIRRRIEEHYAVIIGQPEPVRIADVLERIRMKTNDEA